MSRRLVTDYPPERANKIVSQLTFRDFVAEGTIVSGPIPKGRFIMSGKSGLIPHLVVNGGVKAIEFYTAGRWGA